MRIYNDKDWEYTVAEFETLSHSISWAKRFRLTFYSDRRRTVKNRLRILIGYWLLSLAFYLRCWKKVLQKKPTKKIANLKYLIILDGNNAYLNCLLPICKQLTEQHHSSDYLFFVSNAKRKIVEHRLAAYQISIDNLIDETDLKIKSPLLKIFVSTFQSAFDLLKFVIHFPLKSWLYIPAFYQYAFHQHFFGQSISTILQTTKTLVGASDHWLWDSIFFNEAKKTATKSVIVQHGLIGEFCYPMLSKQYAVWGENDKQVMCEMVDAKPEEVVITGAPHFDDYKRKWNTENQHHDFFKQPYITFFAQPYFKYAYLGEGKYAEVLNWFYQLEKIAEQFGKKLLIKFHPLDRVADYAAKPNTIETTKETLQSVMLLSAIAITVDSAVAYECAVVGLPVIQLSNNYNRFVDLSKNNFTAIADSKQKLEELITQLLSSKENFSTQQNGMQSGMNHYLANAGNSADTFLQIFN